MMNKHRIHFLIERFFIIAGLSILLTTLSVGLYFNKYDEQEKQKNNLQKIHGVLSQLITPSLSISDLSEVRRLLYMASGDEETFVVVDHEGTIIMSDYNKKPISKFLLGYDKSANDCKNLGITYKNIDGNQYLINCSILKSGDVFSGENKLGVLLSFTNYKWFSFSPIIFYVVAILIGLFLILIILFRRMLHRRLLNPLITLKDRIMRISIENVLPCTHIDEIPNASSELVEIKEAFARLLLNLQEEYSRRMEAEKMKALIDLAAGVAHDIRSPLIALDVIIKDIKHISEEQRIVIRNSANRINDIANNLLTQYRDKKNIEVVGAKLQNKSELISDLLMSLISEKRAQYKKNAVTFLMHCEENSYGKFSQIEASTFNRVLSNLIDNAIEALADTIKINLSFKNSTGENMLNIKIVDNGSGILPANLQKIIQGETFSNKAKGHGLGLPHAFKTIEKEWGGRLSIKSSVHSGTTIDIMLPQVTTPDWFLSKLVVSPNESIVILDDDESIHQVWKKRFGEIYADFSYVNHYRPEDLKVWYRHTKSARHIFLIDYEFVGCDTNGLNIINDLNIVDRSFLVTSHQEDSKLRVNCEKMRLKIIPKTFAAHIPIILSKNGLTKKADMIFIDDDVAITDAWVLHGITKNKNIASYNSIRSFKADLSQYNHDTPIYIDSDLNDAIKGEDFAKELYNMGFTNLYLSTGFLGTNFKKMFWIKEIVGKEPPF